MTSESTHYRKRIYEFVTPPEYHGKATESITSRIVWQGFEEQTTAHGISHVRHARGPIKTGFWMLASLTSCALLLYYAYFLFDKFFSYPVNVKVEVISLREIVFPAVTVCNHNPIRKNEVRRGNIRELRELFGYETESEETVAPEGTTERLSTWAGNAGGATTPAPRHPPHHVVPDVNMPVVAATTDHYEVTTTSANISSDTYGNGEGFSAGSGRSQNGRPLRNEFQKFLELQEKIANLGGEEKAAIGYQIQDFLLDCEYSGAFCYTSDFESIYYNSAYGNCFTYNLGINGTSNTSNLEYSYRPGPKYGLALTLNIDQDNYFGGISQEAGVRVVVHSQDRMPFPEDEGISVIPGQLTYVGIRLFTIARLGPPYGGCVEIKSKNKTRNVYEELYGVKYSTTACLKTCYQRHVIERCRCADSAYPMMGQAFGSRQQTPCSINNPEDVACLNEVAGDYQENKLDCDCPTACSESTYTVTTSAVSWPSTDYKGSLFHGLASGNDKVRRIVNNRNDPEKYKRNLVKVVIYFEEFNYESITEAAAYESFNFVSDIGGILGLFVGFSVMTIAEFLELGLDLIVLNAIKKCCRRHNRTRALSSSSYMSREHETDEKKAHPPPYSRTVTPNHVEFSNK